MMRIISTLIFICLLLSCEKPTIEIGESKKLININGIITNKTIEQLVHIEIIDNYYLQDPTFFNNASLIISSATSTYNHTYVDNGNYLSDVAYALSSDTTYDFKFMTENDEFNSSFTMPSPIIINSITNTSEFTKTEIFIDVTSSHSKYFKADIFFGEIDSISQDTIWDIYNYDEKIFDCTNNSSILIVDKEGDFLLYEDMIIKINLMSIDKKTADYLSLLYDYRKNISTTNQFVNPPKSDFTNANGLVYGSCLTSKTKAL